MPSNIIWESKGVLIEFSGALYTSDMHENSIWVSSNPNFESLKYILVDFSGVVSSDIHDDDDDMGMLAAQSTFASLYNATYVVLVVATSPEIIEMNNRYLELVKPTVPVLIFDNIVDARKWIQENIQ